MVNRSEITSGLDLNQFSVVEAEIVVFKIEFVCRWMTTMQVVPVNLFTFSVGKKTWLPVDMAQFYPTKVQWICHNSRNRNYATELILSNVQITALSFFFHFKLFPLGIISKCGIALGIVKHWASGWQNRKVLVHLVWIRFHPDCQSRTLFPARLVTKLFSTKTFTLLERR